MVKIVLGGRANLVVDVYDCVVAGSGHLAVLFCSFAGRMRMGMTNASVVYLIMASYYFDSCSGLIGVA